MQRQKAPAQARQKHHLEGKEGFSARLTRERFVSRDFVPVRQPKRNATSSFTIGPQIILKLVEHRRRKLLTFGRLHLPEALSTRSPRDVCLFDKRLISREKVRCSFTYTSGKNYVNTDRLWLQRPLISGKVHHIKL